MEEIAKLVSGWPEDREVPAKLRRKWKDSRGAKKDEIAKYVEALVVASENEEDIALVEKHWG